jgi:hypothetical protein
MTVPYTDKAKDDLDLHLIGTKSSGEVSVLNSWIVSR